MRRTVALVFALALAGCAAAPKTMTRSEMLRATSRTYCDVDRETLFKAAEAVLRLNDPNDVQVAWPDERTMVARHSWLIYLVLAASSGQHVWRFTVDDAPEKEGCLRARVLVSNAPSFGMFGAVGATSGGGAAPMVVPQNMPGNVINQPAVYELFWDQLDYLLGKRNSWPTCANIWKRIKSGRTYGNPEPLCLFVNDQVKPTEERGRKILAEIGLEPPAASARKASNERNPGS